MSRLDEVSHADLTPLGECLKRHLGKGRYVHFSKIKKMGVNPKQHHSDPPGVYFYPVDWLWHHERFHEGEQFATNWPYYFIVDIDFSKPGLDLSKITEPEIKQLAARNGWLEDFEGYVDRFRLDKGPVRKMWIVLGSLWRKRGWMKLLRGLSWVNDKDGIIMAHEPEQVCVMDPRCMRIVETGEQKEISSYDWEKWDYWRRPVSTLMNTLRTKHGGDVVWRNKKPTWKVSGDNWEFSLSWADRSYGGLRYSMRTGRATDSDTLATDKLRKLSLDEITSKIEEHLSMCQNFDGNDLDFTPMITQDEVLKLIDEHVYNARKPEWEIMKGYKFMRADVHSTAGYPPCNTNFAVGVSDTKVWVMCTVKINGQLVASISQTAPEEFDEKFIKTFEMYCPGQPDPSDHRAFSEEEWEPFLGWLFHQTGLKVFEKHEEDFSRYRNVKELYGQIERVFSRVGW